MPNLTSEGRAELALLATIATSAALFGIARLLARGTDGLSDRERRALAKEWRGVQGSPRTVTLG